MSDYYGERPADMSPTPTVLAIMEMNITGNIVPSELVRNIRTPGGQADIVAAIVLSHFIEQCRLHEIDGTEYHESYSLIAQKYNMSRTVIKDAVYRLIKIGAVSRDLRTINVNGTPVSNVPFWTVNLEVVIPLLNDKMKLPSKSNSEPLRPNKRTRFSVLKRDGYKCCICGRTPEDGIVLEVDHRHPRIKGGNNHASNLWTLCRECNVGKSAEDL